MSVHLPLLRELCPFNLAPVTSTVMQMLFGDTVAIAMMQVRPSLHVLGEQSPGVSPGAAVGTLQMLGACGQVALGSLERGAVYCGMTAPPPAADLVLQARHLSEDEYAKNHPAGRIGKRLMLRVSDVMLHSADELPLVTPDMLMADALMELTSKGWVWVLGCTYRSPSCPPADSRK